MSSNTILNLWKKNLGQVPSSVWDNVSLEALILADNGLTEVSARLGQLKSLRMLDLGHNRLSTIPETIGEIVGLRALAPEGIFLSRIENLEDGKNVPQRLKPGMAASFTARLKPCPSTKTAFSRRLFNPESIF
jgi:Leucine-rich repeat (LRR) protein